MGAPLPGSGNAGDRARAGQLADLLIAAIGDVKVPGPIDGQPGRTGELGRVGQPAITARRRMGTRSSRAGHPRDRPGGSDLPDLIVLGVGDVDVAGTVDGDPRWEAQLRIGGRSSIAAVGRVLAEGSVA